VCLFVVVEVKSTLTEGNSCRVCILYEGNTVAQDTILAWNGISKMVFIEFSRTY
jgi:hypothetical protein